MLRHSPGRGNGTFTNATDYLSSPRVRPGRQLLLAYDGQTGSHSESEGSLGHFGLLNLVCRETGNLASSTWLVHLGVNTAGMIRPLVRQVVRSDKTIENIEKLAGEPVSRNLRAHLCFQ